MNRFLKVALALYYFIGGATYAAEDFATFASPTAGALGTVQFSVSETGSGTASIIGTGDFSGPDYNPPGSPTQPNYQWDQPNTVRFDFSSPVTNLDVYLYYLRGPGAGGSAYTFTVIGSAGSWQIRSGLTGVSISGDTINPSLAYSNGVLRYTGSITSLIITPLSAGNSLQGLTFGLDIPPAPNPIPTLSEWAEVLMMLAMIAAAGLYGWRMHQR